MIQYTLRQMRRLLANRKIGLYIVTKIRNQCELIVARAHASDFGKNPVLNGEAKWGEGG